MAEAETVSPTEGFMKDTNTGLYRIRESFARRQTRLLLWRIALRIMKVALGMEAYRRG